MMMIQSNQWVLISSKLESVHKMHTFYFIKNVTNQIESFHAMKFTNMALENIIPST